ncbi:MAG: transaldolase [Anaerolineaceae bacterium]|nr:transaldolase [Anaerolineaceae bacterium]
MNSIDKLHSLNQSIWYDNIERRLLENGEMEKLIRDGDIRGVTSNPSIFQKAIANSNDYDAALLPMAWSDWSEEEMFFQVAVEDIRSTADLFNALYENSKGKDGYVSLEVSPKLAYETEATIEQAVSLWQRVNRKNLMIKIPATLDGLQAIRKTISAGVNVNVTLIFSVERYEEVIDAYISGLEDRVNQGLPIDGIHSVASFFVSRVDSLIDKKLTSLHQEGKISADELQEYSGKAAIANSKMAYKLYLEKFSQPRFKELEKKGANRQRPLWASTSTKNPAYSDVLYVEELIGENTVNTMPPQTLDAFRDHGKAEEKITKGVKEAEELLTHLESLGISMQEVTQKLEDDGVKSFADAFQSMLETIRERKETMQLELGLLKSLTSAKVAALKGQHLVTRIYEKDASIWTDDKEGLQEIRKRLGWLDAPYFAKDLIPQLVELRDEILAEDYTHVLLLGMGGSSLAAEVLSQSFKGQADGLTLNILDSTDPRQVKEAESIAPLEKTLFLVSSKSGSTSEVQAFLSYFYTKLVEKTGKENAGSHFVAITDPGTILEKQAVEMNFRKVLNADPNVGGRYSALTMFGLVPAVLMGIDLDTFIQRTIQYVNQFRPGVPVERNPGLVLGAVLGTAYEQGLDKLTILAEEPFRSFGSWMEQLIAESSGKEGKGIVPIDIEPLVAANSYSKDRLFVYLKHDGVFSDFADELVKNGHPVLTFKINSAYDLGAEFFRWEFATAVACAVLNVNAFDQPDVQDNKNRTKNKISVYENTKKLEEDDPQFENEKVKLFWSHHFSEKPVNGVSDLLQEIFGSVKENDFVAINAYLPRNPDQLSQLQAFRKTILEKTGIATTLGFGPRFLHSTGQLHKGGADNAIFIQLTDDAKIAVSIPEHDYDFNVLQRAQAIGDYEALVARDRRVVRIHLKNIGVNDLI